MFHIPSSDFILQQTARYSDSQVPVLHTRLLSLREANYLDKVLAIRKEEAKTEILLHVWGPRSFITLCRGGWEGGRLQGQGERTRKHRF